jgi:succinate-acetate transporter protein
VLGSARFAVTGLYEILGDTGLERAAAIIGFALAATALYTAAATEVRWRVSSSSSSTKRECANSSELMLDG